jgi:hypothetical protein
MGDASVKKTGFGFIRQLCWIDGGVAVFLATLSFFEFDALLIRSVSLLFLVCTSCVLVFGLLSGQRFTLTQVLQVQFYLAFFLSLVLSLWPLHVKFAISRPALTQFIESYDPADVDPSPRWIGLFYVRRVDVQRYQNCVWLITKDQPSGPTGLLFGPTEDVQHPGNEWHGIPMNANWRYTHEC